MNIFSSGDRVTVTWITGSPAQQTTNHASATVIGPARGTGPFNAEPDNGYAVCFDDTPEVRVFVPAHHLTPAGGE